MRKRALGWTVVAFLLGVALGGAYLIVAHNNPALNASAEAMPGGVFH